MAENTSGQEQRKARLARQLRENLKRRKAQARNLARDLAQARREPAARGEKTG
jgi:hypothetical protein